MMGDNPTERAPETPQPEPPEPPPTAATTSDSPPQPQEPETRIVEEEAASSTEAPADEEKTSAAEEPPPPPPPRRPPPPAPPKYYTAEVSATESLAGRAACAASAPQRAAARELHRVLTDTYSSRPPSWRGEHTAANPIPPDLETASVEVQLLNVELSCPICLRLMREPMATKCLHRFCKDCINRHHHNNKQCPSCRTEIRTLRTMRPDRSLATLISKLYPDIEAFEREEEEETRKENAARIEAHAAQMAIMRQRQRESQAKYEADQQANRIKQKPSFELNLREGPHQPSAPAVARSRKKASGGGGGNIGGGRSKGGGGGGSSRATKPVREEVVVEIDDDVEEEEEEAWDDDDDDDGDEDYDEDDDEDEDDEEDRKYNKHPSSSSSKIYRGGRGPWSTGESKRRSDRDGDHTVVLSTQRAPNEIAFRLQRHAEEASLTNELPRDYCIVEGKATILQVQRLLAYQLKEQLGKRKRRDDNEEEEEGGDAADLFALYLRIPGPSQKLSPALAPHLRLEEVKKRYQLGGGYVDFRYRIV